MKKLTKKQTTHDSFQTIWLDYQYPHTDIINHTVYWIVSQDIKNEQFLIYVELVEEFVDSASKLAKSPFVFEKTLEGTILKEENQLGALFYDLLRLQNEIAVNPGEIRPHLFSATFKIHNCERRQYLNRYEVSENSKILYSVASDLNLHRANFTGNPMSRMGTEGLLEGELISSVFTRLREATKRKSFKMKVNERKKESTQSFTKTKRYIDRLYANSPRLFGVPMVICYQGEYANQITLEESNNHLMKFLEAFETDLTLGSPGWWWKREYMTEISYRYYLIFFFDGQKIPYNPKLIQDVCGRHWRSVTRDRGAYFIPPVPEMDHQHCGTGLSQQGYGDSLELILSGMQRMLMRDIFLRLQRSKKIDHFGMGELPRLVDGTPPNNSFTQLR